MWMYIDMQIDLTCVFVCRDTVSDYVHVVGHWIGCLFALFQKKSFGQVFHRNENEFTLYEMHVTSDKTQFH